MPTLPPWEGLHPVAVHFPVAYLLFAPMLTFLMLLARERRRSLAGAALTVALLGAGGATLAVQTGEASERVVQLPTAAEPVFHEHEERAERIPLFAWSLAAAMAVLVLTPTVRKRATSERIERGALGLLLVLQLATALYVANAAHLGGRLVHEFGVHAPWPTSK